MDFKEYQELAKRTDSIKIPQDEVQMEKALTNAALGACGEAGEFADIVKKIYHQGHEFTEELQVKMLHELGDQLWYIAKAARLLGFSLETVAKMNIYKLEKRYPNLRFEAKKSINREE